MPIAPHAAVKAFRGAFATLTLFAIAFDSVDWLEIVCVQEFLVRE